MSLIKRHNNVLPGFGPTLGFTVFYLSVIVLIPLSALVFRTAGLTWGEFISTVTAPRVLASYRVTFGAAIIAAVINSVFGVLVAWVLVRYRFPGRRIVDALVDLPFALPTAVAGITLATIYSPNGWVGRFLEPHGIKVAFTPVGIVLATIFVTFPFVARELIPLMEAQGKEEEEAALVLGASGLQTFFRVTLPNIKWGIIYGVILCNARAMGEFGAVSVVSGHIRGMTNTVPLHVEILYNEYNYTDAFAVASLLVFLALITLMVKTIAEWKVRQQLEND